MLKAYREDIPTIRDATSREYGNRSHKRSMTKPIRDIPRLVRSPF